MTANLVFLLPLLLALAISCSTTATVTQNPTTASTRIGTPIAGATATPQVSSTSLPGPKSGTVPTISSKQTPGLSPRPPDTFVPAEGSSITLSAAEVRGLTHLGISSALADLSERVGGEVGSVSMVSAENVTWSDTSLGCPEPDGLYAQVLTPGIRLILGYNGQEFDYRVAGIHGLLCTQEDTRGPLAGCGKRGSL